jgi:hypothetical protein
MFSCIFFSCFESKTVIKYVPENNVEDPVIEIPIGEVDIMMKAIPEANNYFIRDDKKLYSIDHAGMNLIEIIDEDGDPLILHDFFRKNNESFFTIKSIVQVENPAYDPACDPNTETCAPEFLTQEVFTHFRQTYDEVTEIDVLPVKPPVSRAQYESENFSIQNVEYEGEMYSDIRNKYMDFMMRFQIIEGAVVYVEMQGMWFHSSSGFFHVKQPGLYFFPLNRTVADRYNSTGVLW